MVVSQHRGSSIQTPKRNNPCYFDPLKGTPDTGRPLICRVLQESTACSRTTTRSPYESGNDCSARGRSLGHN